MPDVVKAVMRVSTAGADYLFAQANKIAENAVRDVLEGIEKDIKDNWSPISPSDPYTPPAVVTGYLDQSIKTERRDARGRFATFGNAVRYALRVEADYGMALEFGREGLEERPFFFPAIRRAEGKLGQEISVDFQLAAAKAHVLTKAQYLKKMGF